MAKGKEQMAKVVAILIVLLTSGVAHAMGSSKFGTYTQAYLDRQRYLVFSVAHDGAVWFNKADAIRLPARQCEMRARQRYSDGVTAACYREEEFRALP
jgi:hypothetical protein